MEPRNGPITLAGLVTFAAVGAVASALFFGGPPGPVAGLGGPLLLLIGGFGTGFYMGYRTPGARVRAYTPVALAAWILTTMGALLAFPLTLSRLDWLSFVQLCVIEGLAAAVAAGVGGLFGWEFREGLKETNPI